MLLVRFYPIWLPMAVIVCLTLLSLRNTPKVHNVQNCVQNIQFYSKFTDSMWVNRVPFLKCSLIYWVTFLQPQGKLKTTKDLSPRKSKINHIDIQSLLAYIYKRTCADETISCIPAFASTVVESNFVAAYCIATAVVQISLTLVDVLMIK